MARTLTRRSFLDLSAVTLGGIALTGCLPEGAPEIPPAAAPGATADDGATPAPETSPGSDGTAPAPAGKSRVGVASYAVASARASAVRDAVALAGGMPWLKPGDTVLIKPAHNSMKPYPFTASAVACAELASMCLEAGASKVTVADVMGIENTLVPGRWAMESPYGGAFYADTDATVRAFKASGLYDAVVARVGAANVGKGRKVEITSFREHGWSPFETGPLTAGKSPRLCSDWVRAQLKTAETWTGEPKIGVFKPRKFDELHGEDAAGFYVPNLVKDVDHVINLHRISTHVMSHFTLSIKNWVGIMRPDDRVWMHQLSYCKNNRGKGSDPIRTEPLYNEMLAELHLATKDKTRLFFADASEVIASGGPDHSDRDIYPAKLMVASNDAVAADVVGLSIIRMAVFASAASGGLGGVCFPPPQKVGQLALEDVLGQILPWHGGAMYGNDAKLCDPKFSHWDWVAVQRAREIGLGAAGPADLDLRFATTPGLEVPKPRRDFIVSDAAIPPARALT